MKQVLVLFCVFVAAQAWGGVGLRVRFGLGLLGGDYFVDVPKSVSKATKAGWTLTPRPDGLLPILSMYCYSSKMICALFDDTEYIAGLQVAYPLDKFKDDVLDWETRGFQLWTPAGSDTSYRAIQQFYVNEEFLATDSKTRIAQRDSKKLLQAGGVWVVGTNRQLLKIPDSERQMTSAGFTKQGCIPAMGRHYYYNMTSDLTCTAEHIYAWFPLVHQGDLVATGLIAVGKLPEDSTRDWFERPDSTAVKLIVPNGPQCLYELADNPGLVTMHIYYVDNPLLLLFC